MLCCHFGTFWATEKAWAWITANYQTIVWWNNDSNEEEKGNWDSKRLYKFKVSLQSRRQISVVVSDVFEYVISKKSTYPLAYFFLVPHLTRLSKFYVAFFFPHYGNPPRPRSRINPEISNYYNMVNIICLSKDWYLCFICLNNASPYLQHFNIKNNKLLKLNIIWYET